MPADCADHLDTIEIVDENLSDGFAQVPRPVLKAAGLSIKAKAVYALLLDYAWQKGRCFPGQQRLAEDLDVSVDTIQRALRELRQWKLIDWKQQGLNRPNVYYLLRLSDNPYFETDGAGHRKLRFPKTAGRRCPETARLRPERYPENDTQTDDSKVRMESPKTDEARRGAGRSPSPPLLSFPEQVQQLAHRLHQEPECPRSAGEEQPPLCQPELAHRPTKTNQPRAQRRHMPRPSYSQERHVILDVVSDIGREFHDQATLNQSVSRAYNLMQRAGVEDITRFVGLMYEARAITKAHSPGIRATLPPTVAIAAKHKMAYWFSVLEDLCGLKPGGRISPAQ